MEGDALELLRSNRLAVYFIHHTHTEVPTLESCPIEICDMLNRTFPSGRQVAARDKITVNF